MPKRTTPFQMVVHAVRQQLAVPSATVTESRIFVDPANGTDREVDVVIEGSFDGDHVMTCLEVIEHGRKASITWVEQQIKKHQRLPTTKLILVSKSGFSDAAMREITAEGGWVRAVTPQNVTVNGVPHLKLFYADSITMSPKDYRLVVRNRDATLGDIPRNDAIDIYDADGVIRGTLGAWVGEVLNLPWLVNWFQVMAHHHPERAALTGFSCRVAVEAAGYFVHEAETGVPHAIHAVEILGDFTWIQEEVPLTISELDGRRFAAAESANLDGPTGSVGRH